MPIHGRPLLEHWLEVLKKLDVDSVLVNTHYLSEYVEEFIKQDKFKYWVNSVYEQDLLGTAATIRSNANFFKNDTLLLIHADNWTCCDFSDFLHYHHNKRPKDTVMTMMTFTCPNSSSCGIVELDNNGVVVELHEKVENPPGKLANAAVYLIEPEVVEWIVSSPKITDFSTEVIPKFIGRIATWENNEVHRDIGTIEELINAQKDSNNSSLVNVKKKNWQENNYSNIYKIIKEHLND